MDNQDFIQILQEELKNVAANKDLKNLATKELRENHEEFFTAIKKDLIRYNVTDKATDKILELVK